MGERLGATEVFPRGMTVADLKRIIAEWPDEDASGEPTEVWVMTGHGLSSPVVEVCPLNRTDLILTPSNYAGGA